ncbi:MAG TPA: hypothetical protein VN796_08500 [Acidimicrobiales bacterium]|nr:hypothetical protein [Acidimicrobiales bacterium]
MLTTGLMTLALGSPAWGSGVRAPAPSLATVAGTGVAGYSGNRGPARGARLDDPMGIAVDRSGDLFIADTANCALREVPSGNRRSYGFDMRTGHITTVLGGRCPSGSRRPGPGSGTPQGVAVDRAGDLFAVEAVDNRVVELPATTARSRHRPFVVAGTGVSGFSGDGGPAVRARLDGPGGVSVDAVGDLFIADTDNCVVREVPAETGTFYGISMVAHDIYTVAGTGVCGSSGVGGPARSAQLWTPVSVAVDGHGDILISAQGDGAVLEEAATSGTYYGTSIAADNVTTVAGAGLYGTYLGDGFLATFGGAGLNFPDGLAVDGEGDLFIADTYDRCIREVPAVTGPSFGREVTAGDMYTLVGATPAQSQYDVTSAAAAQTVYPTGMAVSPSGSVLFFSDSGTDEVRKVTAPVS